MPESVPAVKCLLPAQLLSLLCSALGPLMLSSLYSQLSSPHSLLSSLHSLLSSQHKHQELAGILSGMNFQKLNIL